MRAPQLWNEFKPRPPNMLKYQIIYHFSVIITAFPHAFKPALWFPLGYFPLCCRLPFHFSTIMLTETFIKENWTLSHFFTLLAIFGDHNTPDLPYRKDQTHSASFYCCILPCVVTGCAFTALPSPKTFQGASTSTSSTGRGSLNWHQYSNLMWFRITVCHWEKGSHWDWGVLRSHRETSRSFPGISLIHRWGIMPLVDGGEATVRQHFKSKAKELKQTR